MSNNVLTISKAEWTVAGAIPDPNQVYIKGNGPGGIDIPATKASVAGNSVFISGVAASTPFPANKTGYYNPFSIQWEVSFEGIAGTYHDAGTSENVIYVSLSDTGPSAVTLFRTTVHLACGRPGAVDADQAVANSWSMFTGRNVCKWNETSGNMTFYCIIIGQVLLGPQTETEQRYTFFRMRTRQGSAVVGLH